MEQDNWISIENRLPDIGDDVLATNENDNWIRIANRKKKNWYNSHQDQKNYDYLPIYPTHWQPLPEPPQTQQPK